MSEYGEIDFHLVTSDRCPKCGETALYEPGGEWAACRVCRGVFLDGDAVRLGNELGTIHEIDFEEAREALSEDDDCDCCRVDPSDEAVDSLIEEHWLFVPEKAVKEHGADLARALGRQISREDPLIVHASAWTPPPVGPGHPVYEEALEVVRKYAGASRRVEHFRGALHQAQERERATWAEVRPALTALVEAAKVEPGTP